MKIYFDNVLINEDYYTNYKNNTTIFNESESFKLGSTPCTEIDLSIDEQYVPNNPQIVTIYKENVLIGTYQIDSIEKESGVYNYKLVDAMVNFNFNYNAKPFIDASETGLDIYEKTTDETFQEGKSYYKLENDAYILLVSGTDYNDGDNIEDIGYTVYEYKELAKYRTLGEILQNICDTANVELATTTFLGNLKKITWYDNRITAREYIGYIAELNGGYACINANGKLELKRYSNNEIAEISFDECSDYEIGEYHKISRVVYDNGLGTFEPVGTETNNTLYLNTDNVYITEQNDIQNIYNIVNGLEFYSFETQNCPQIQKSNGANIDIDGNSYQYTTTGKNLFDGSAILSKKYVNRNNGNIGSSDDWSASDFIEIKPNTMYIYSGITQSWSSIAGQVFYDENKNYISGISSNTYSFTTPTNAKYIRLSLNNETPNNVMLEEGTQATPYEPYTGGIPSPNPDYPQEIESVDGYNLWENTNTLQYVENLSEYTLGKWYKPSTITFVEDGEHNYYTRNADSNYYSFLQKIPYSKVRNKTITVSIEYQSEYEKSMVFSYQLSATLTGNRTCYRDYNSAYKQTDSWTKLSQTFTITDDFFTSGTRTGNEPYFAVGIYFRVSSGTSNIKIRKPQLAISAKEIPYAPYKNISIKNVGKNLFDEEYAKTLGTSAANETLMAIQLEPNEQYTFSRFVDTPFAYDAGYYLYFATNENPNTSAFPLNYTGMGTITSGHLTITTGTSGIILLKGVYANNTRVATYLSKAKVQIEKENVTNPIYEPYQESISLIPLNQPLRSIGDTKDTLELDNAGNIKVTRRIGHIVFNGSENWSRGVNGGLTRYASQEIIDVAYSTSRAIISSNYFYYLSSGNEVGAGFIYAQQFFAYPNQDITTVAAFKTWLSTHNTEVDYVLATPVVETYTTTPLEIYEGVNNISLYSSIDTTFNTNYINTTLVGDCIKFVYNEDEYPIFLQIDNSYNGEFIGGYSFKVNTEKQEETNIIGSNDAIKSIRANLDRDKAEWSIVANKVGDNTEDLSSLSVALNGITSSLNNYVTQDEKTSLQNTTLELAKGEFNIWYNETGLAGTINDLKDALENNSSNLNILSNYFRYDALNNRVIIGSSGSSAAIVITPTQVNFMDGGPDGSIKAYINENGFNFPEGAVTNKLYIGHWETKEDEQHNLNTHWIGG